MYDPLLIKIGAALFSGAAEQLAVETVRAAFADLPLPDDHEERAKLYREHFERIQSEAQDWPPDRALMFLPHAEPDKDAGTPGIHGNDRTLRFGLRIINRADFVVHSFDLFGEGVVSVADCKVRYLIDHAEELTFDARGDRNLWIDARPSEAWPPSIDQPEEGHLVARLDLKCQVTVAGPWQDMGKRFVPVRVPLWIPLLATFAGTTRSERDARIILADWAARLPRGTEQIIEVDKVESSHRAPRGSLVRVLKQLAKEQPSLWSVKVADRIVVVRRTDTSIYLRNRALRF